MMEMLNVRVVFMKVGIWETYAGTAGAMLLFSEAEGVRDVESSFSRRVFSLEMIRREVIV